MLILGKVRNACGIQAPQVYAWNAHASGEGNVAEYIIMEKAKGVLLSSKWPSMNAKEKYRLTENIIAIESNLVSKKFNGIGSLYYELSLHNSKELLHNTVAPGFVIGPTTDRRFLQDGRGKINSDKGPCEPSILVRSSFLGPFSLTPILGKTAIEYILALATREKQCIEQSPIFPQPEGIFNGPGSYQPTAKSKIAVLNDFLKVAHFLLPKEPSIHAPVLWHSDLHHDNIFVDEADPSKILSIIDWQATHIAPLFQQATTPAFLDFVGEKPAPGLSSHPSQKTSRN
jgi:hypothetical protein